MRNTVANAAEPEQSKKYYGGTVTVDGRNLITSLMAGETIEFTRIVVGSGSMPEGVEPIDMKELVTPVAAAVSTIPVVKNGEMFLTVEYRNDLNGGLKEGLLLLIEIQSLLLYCPVPLSYLICKLQDPVLLILLD